MACHDCEHLNKNMMQKATKTEHFRYGCRSDKKDPYIVGWIYKDYELKHMGCSYYKKIEEFRQLSLF